MTTPYTAQGLAAVDAMFVRQFFLDAGGQPTFEEVTVASGQTLSAGHVLGKIAASDELVECDPGAGDGSEVPYAILMENLDTTAGADTVSVLTTSNRLINFRALVHHAAWDPKELRAALSRRPIATRTPIYSAL